MLRARRRRLNGFSLCCLTSSRAFPHTPPHPVALRATDTCPRYTAEWDHRRLTRSTRHTVIGFQGRGSGSPLLATCSFSPFLSFSWLARDFLFLFGRHGSWACPCGLPLLPILDTKATLQHADPHTSPPLLPPLWGRPWSARPRGHREQVPRRATLLCF